MNSFKVILLVNEMLDCLLLESLKGDLAGFYSIRINVRWRIVFCWTDRGPAEVAIVDYH